VVVLSGTPTTAGKLDFKLNISVKDGKFDINGSFDGSGFKISGNVTDDKINMKGQLTDVSEGDGAVIKAGSGDFKNPYNIVATKQADGENSSSEESSMNYFIDTQGTTYIKDNDRKRETPTKKNK
jgi:hypothetical protein